MVLTFTFEILFSWWKHHDTKVTKRRPSPSLARHPPFPPPSLAPSMASQRFIHRYHDATNWVRFTILWPEALQFVLSTWCCIDYIFAEIGIYHRCGATLLSFLFFSTLWSTLFEIFNGIVVFQYEGYHMGQIYSRYTDLHGCHNLVISLVEWGWRIPNRKACSTIYVLLMHSSLWLLWYVCDC